jgi:hypothetical protein
MPDARLPDDPTTAEPGDWYTADELAVLPLASASMWDVPVTVDGITLHVLASQLTAPTPSSRDGVASPAALRNADEIRFWAAYVAAEEASWIVDDQGVRGGLAPGAEFVVAGDLNADPVDGDSVDGAIQQLLDVDRVQDPGPTSDGAAQAAELQAGANVTHQGDPAADTADLVDDPAPGNLRTDYVLPSNGLDVVGTAVYWPANDDPRVHLVSGDPPASSDHRLVWVDVLHASPAMRSATRRVPSAQPDHQLSSRRRTRVPPRR